MNSLQLQKGFFRRNDSIMVDTCVYVCMGVKYSDLKCPDVHDDVFKWKHFPRYWPFVRGIHRSPVNSPHNGQWRVWALMFSLICTWINGWVNNRLAGDLRRHPAHYDVIVMTITTGNKQHVCRSSWNRDILRIITNFITGNKFQRNLNKNALNFIQGNDIWNVVC